MKILIIRRDNIGDLICTTPVFTALREKYPNAYIAVLGNSYCVPAIRGNPHVDDIFYYNKRKHVHWWQAASAYLNRARLLWRLRQMRFDYVILAAASFPRHALSLARFIAAKHVIGFVSSSANSPRINLPVSLDTLGKMHETEYLFKLLEPLGIQGLPPPLNLVADQALAAQIKHRLPPSVSASSGPLIALHISARKEKQRWPVEQFSALAHQLSRQYAARFLIFWSPGDAQNPFHPGDDDKAADLLTHLQTLPAAPVRTDHLAQLIAGISLCDFAVLSDGGAMHIAAALMKPIVCFFGNSDEKQWHPWRVPHEILKKETRQVADISVEETLAAFQRLYTRVQNSPTPSHPLPPPSLRA